MTPTGQQENISFVVGCGRNLFLGIGTPARTGTVERARRFLTRDEAQAAADALRIRGAAFVLPWEVRAINTSSEVR